MTSPIANAVLGTATGIALGYLAVKIISTAAWAANYGGM